MTLLEQERLQTVPDNYTDIGISDAVRHKALGNGFTVDVIAHIFNCINNKDNSMTVSAQQFDSGFDSVVDKVQQTRDLDIATQAQQLDPSDFNDLII